MKLVTAIIKPPKLDAVQDALCELGQSGMTVTEVRGYGRQRGQTAIYRGAEYSVSFVPKIKIEMAVNDEDVDGIVDVISKTARTGSIGDGKIFVYDLLEAYRIRTGEAGSSAL